MTFTRADLEAQARDLRKTEALEEIATQAAITSHALEEIAALLRDVTSRTYGQLNVRAEVTSR